MNKFDIHMDICHDLNALYQRKNHDYGDSFGEFFAEFGLISTCMRLTDKLKRLKSFAQNGKYKVTDESVRDTLMDLANYSIMTIVEMEMHKAEPAADDGPKLYCPSCVHKSLRIGDPPCSECYRGGGSDPNIVYYQEDNVR